MCVGSQSGGQCGSAGDSLQVSFVTYVTGTLLSWAAVLACWPSHDHVQSAVYRAEAQRHAEAGKVSTGEDEEQRDDIFQQRADLARQACGVRVASRVTVSARTQAGVLDARDRAGSQWMGMGVSELRWYDGRQDAAMLLGLPLGRGWR